MRILGVHFQNLNSLTGEWQVDFTHEAFASDGIFAITGPTGSGKTTILDAICLGLYGRTPRLDKVTKSSNEIMSRQTGVCFAEVTFETQKGRYRCHWSQHRSRRNSTGDLQQAKHEIADANTGTVLESRMTQVAEFIEKVTGMNFERFTRSMLLAQGGFAAFLQASPDNRAPILEQITGTEIYSLISIKVHERRKEELEKLELLQAKFQGILVLSIEEEAQLQAGLKEKHYHETELDSKVDDFRKAAQWLEELANLEKDISELDRQWQEFADRTQAFAPEAEKLARSRKALTLEGDYRGVMTLRIQQVTEISELSDAVALLQDMEKAKTEALSLKQTAESALTEARNIQSASADVIKQVREHDARLSEQKKQLQEKDKALATVEQQKEEYKSRLENNVKALKTAQAGLETVQEYQSAHAADAALTTHLAVIVRGLETLGELEIRYLQAKEALTGAAKKKEAAQASGKKYEADHEQCRRKLEAGQIEQKCLADELAAVLQGREIAQWREEGDALKERERLLSQTGTTLERIDETHKALENLKVAKETLKAGQNKLSVKIKLGLDRKELLEKEVSGLETQISLLARIRDLEAERKRLEDGKACPLCGATDHPYAKGNVPELNNAEAVLKKAKADFKIVSEAHTKLQAKQAESIAEIRHRENEIAQKKAAQEADKEACSDTLAKLNIAVAPEIHAGVVREVLASVQGKLTEIIMVITTADDLGKKEKAAQNAVEALRIKFDATVSALQKIKVKMETATLEYAQLNKKSNELAAETEKTRAAALQDIEPFGIKQLPSQDIDAVRNDLTTRHDMWQTKQNEKTAAEKKIAGGQAEISQVQALLTSLEKDVATRREERNALLETCAMQNADRLALFGKKNPDEEEKRLIAVVDQASQAVEKGREDYEKSDRELGTLKEKIAVFTTRTEKRVQELAEAMRQLTERLPQAGFTDEADYVSACMSEEGREKLASRERELIREKTELETRRKDKTALQTHAQEKHLTEQPLATLQENIITCESDLKQARLDIGGLTQRLSENEKQRENRQERLQAMDARKKECARWNDLHELIGSADGKKFRNFAQGLTFEMMTAQANRQLRKMTERYLLIRDASQPLELNVIDNYQAGEIRSTKNLSGGESFIVSLALALGLSQMASRNVRVDSLFLDEGFGTLDDDALETALVTLAGLQQDGKLIGVISHIPALKDRIGTQITVTPGSGGRSSLNGPGCRRI